MRRLALVVGIVLLGTAAPAYADTTARGSGGQKLTVSESTGLSRAGETVTVSGSGYDVNKGIYVAYCVDNGAGAVPTPCGGGADTTGSLGASHWISSNPPSYGEGLAVPYGAGGSFRVSLKITSKIGDVDCTTRRCAVVTRTDHTRTADRSQDVRVPVTFAGAGGGTRTTAPASQAPPANRTTAAAPRSQAATTPTAKDAPANPPAAAPGGSASAASGEEPLAVTRVSESTTSGRWWTGTVIVLGAGLLVLLLLRWRRRGRRP